MPNDTMVVLTIDHQGDRVLLYSHWRNFYVIASPEQAEDVRVGSHVEYEPGGFNFGWFVKLGTTLQR